MVTQIEEMLSMQEEINRCYDIAGEGEIELEDTQIIINGKTFNIMTSSDLLESLMIISNEEIDFIKGEK